MDHTRTRWMTKKVWWLQGGGDENEKGKGVAAGGVGDEKGCMRS